PEDEGGAAGRVPVAAGGPGRAAAGRGAQVGAVGRRRLPRQRTAGISAQGADEGGRRAGAGRGYGLVEALAAGPGHVLAGDGGAGGGQVAAPPDMVEVERSDDDDRIHGGPRLRLELRGDGQAGAGAPARTHHQPKCVSTPAMVAVMKVAIEPPGTARRPKRARSWRRSGARP